MTKEDYKKQIEKLKNKYLKTNCTLSVNDWFINHLTGRRYRITQLNVNENGDIDVSFVKLTTEVFLTPQVEGYFGNAKEKILSYEDIQYVINSNFNLK